MERRVDWEPEPIYSTAVEPHEGTRQVSFSGAGSLALTREAIRHGILLLYSSMWLVERLLTYSEV